MKNMKIFMIQAILALLIMTVGLGVVFCYQAGSVEYFVPFMKFGSMFIGVICMAISLLNKA